MTDLLGAMLLMALLVGAVVVANRTTLLNSIKQSATNSRAESRKAAVRKSLSCPALMELENPQEAVLACAEMFTKFEERAPRASFAGKSMPKTPSLPALVEGSSEGESGLGRAAASSSNSDVDLTDLLGMSGSAAEHAPHVVVLGDARVGKTAVIESLESFDPEGRLRMVEGLPPAGGYEQTLELYLGMVEFLRLWAEGHRRPMQELLRELRLPKPPALKPRRRPPKPLVSPLKPKPHASRPRRRKYL